MSTTFVAVTDVGFALIFYARVEAPAKNTQTDVQFWACTRSTAKSDFYFGLRTVRGDVPTEYSDVY